MDSEVSSETAVTAGGSGVIKHMSLIFILRVVQ
jgi:hypothetical protein